MVWSSTCIVMSSSPRIAPCLLMSTSSGACTAKTLCWPAVITAKQIFVKKYRAMVIIISKSRFGSISIDRISLLSTGSSFGTFCSLRSKLNSDDHNTLHAFYVSAPLIRLTWATKCSTAPSNLSRVDRSPTMTSWPCWLFQEQFPFRKELSDAWKVTLNKITLH